MKLGFEIAMAVLGIIGTAMNYATHCITWNDPDGDNSRIWMFGVIGVLFAMLLIAAACWLYCLCVG